MRQSSKLGRLACRTPWHLLGWLNDFPRRCTENMPFEGQIQHVRWSKHGLVWAIPVDETGKGLMRSVFGDSNDDWTGVVEVQQAEVFATAAGETRLTEVRADRVRMMVLVVRLAYCKTS
jgi:hypothetical protein